MLLCRRRGLARAGSTRAPRKNCRRAALKNSRSCCCWPRQRGAPRARKMAACKSNRPCPRAGHHQTNHQTSTEKIMQRGQRSPMAQRRTGGPGPSPRPRSPVVISWNRQSNEKHIIITWTKTTTTGRRMTTCEMLHERGNHAGTRELLLATECNVKAFHEAVCPA